MTYLWSLDSDEVRYYNNTGSISGDQRSFAISGALSPDGKTVVESHWGNPGLVRDVATGKPRSTVRIGEIGFGVGGVRFAPDSTTLAVNEGGDTGKIFFLDVPTSTVLRSTPSLGKSWLSTLAFSPDGHALAVGDESGVITLVETATAKVRLRFNGHLGKINDLAFTPDGNLLATASADGTILVWDLDRLPGLPADRVPLSEKRLLALWADLGSEDAATAYRAIVLLGRDRQKAPAFLLQQLRTLGKHDPKQVRQWVADLKSRTFAVRDIASAELALLEDVAGPFLREALENKPALEQRRRLELLVRKLQTPNPSPRQLLVLRVMEALEQGAIPEVRTWLEELSRSVPGTRLTTEASLALGRLQKRTKSGKE